jgi:hypothetical protein
MRVLSVGHFSAIYLITTLSLIYIFHIILLPQLLSTNHKCIHSSYFTLLLNCCSEDGENMDYFEEFF